MLEDATPAQRELILDGRRRMAAGVPSPDSHSRLIHPEDRRRSSMIRALSLLAQQAPLAEAAHWEPIAAAIGERAAINHLRERRLEAGVARALRPRALALT